MSGQPCMGYRVAGTACQVTDVQPPADEASPGRAGPQGVIWKKGPTGPVFAQFGPACDLGVDEGVAQQE